MNDKTLRHIIQSFPQLEGAHFLRRLASPVPLVPDTTFDIYVDNSNEYYVLVTTDYIDAVSQREELLNISGSNEFKITAIVEPLKVAGDTIKLAEIDNYKGEWFVENKENGAHPTYSYLAVIDLKS